MKKNAIVKLSVLLCIVCLSFFVVRKIFPRYNFHAGSYTVAGGDPRLDQYVVFNEPYRKWHSGSSAAISYGINGEYVVEGRKIILTARNKTATMEFQVISDSEIQVVFLDENIFYEDQIPWVKEGDIFVLQEEFP